MPIKSYNFSHSPRNAQIVHVSYGRRRPIPSYALSIQCNAIIFGLNHNINTRVKWKRVSKVLLLYNMINTAHSNRRSTRSTPAYCQRLPHIQQIYKVYTTQNTYISESWLQCIMEVFAICMLGWLLLVASSKRCENRTLVPIALTSSNHISYCMYNNMHSIFKLMALWNL